MERKRQISAAVLAVALGGCGGSSSPPERLTEPSLPAPIDPEYVRIPLEHGNEPLLFAAPGGTLFITALQHLYRSSDGGASWLPLAGPIYAGTLNLASDSALAMDPGGRLYFTFDWPYAGSTAVCTSDDLGDSWACNPAVGPGPNDRMWILAPRDDAAYMVTNAGLYQTTLHFSADRGATWSVAQTGNGLLEPQTGPLLEAPGGGGTVLQVVKQEGMLGFYRYAATPMGAGLAGFSSTGVAAPYALPSAVFAPDGMLYTVSDIPDDSGNRPVVVLRSADNAESFTALPPIPGSGAGTSIFSWVAAGAPGHVGVIYYQTDQQGDPGLMIDAQWSAVWAETFDARSEHPAWTLTTVDPLVRVGALCAYADCSAANRWAGDFITALIDTQGDRHLAWMAMDGNGIPEMRYRRIARIN